VLSVQNGLLHELEGTIEVSKVGDFVGSNVGLIGGWPVGSTLSALDGTIEG